MIFEEAAEGQVYFDANDSQSQGKRMDCIILAVLRVASKQSYQRGLDGHLFK